MRLKGPAACARETPAVPGQQKFAKGTPSGILTHRLVPSTGLIRQLHPILRFMAQMILPLLGYFIKNVHNVATSGARIADLAIAGGASMTDTGAGPQPSILSDAVVQP